MKNFLKQILLTLFFVIVVFLAVGYYINYQAAGDLAFTSKDIVVYSTPDLSKASYSLRSGETFNSLVNFSDHDSVKIRFFNLESGKDEIGFIKSSDYFIYDFDLFSLNNSDLYIMSLNANLSFEDFLEEFSQASLERGIIGIYLEDSDYSENDFLRITSFCEDLKIPYGFRSDFTNANVEKYIEQKSFDSGEYWQSYCILPQVFDVSSVINGYKFKDELCDCIFQSPAIRDDNIKRYWITSINHQDLSGAGILITTSESDVGFEYATVSTDFKDEISAAYYDLNSNP